MDDPAPSRDHLVDTNEAARRMGLKPNTLARARVYGGAGSCPWIRLGRAVRYRVADIERYLAANGKTSTAEY